MRKIPVQLEQAHVDGLRLQYELSMAIGTSLDTQMMLKHALSSFLRMLNCAAGSIYLCPFEGEPFEPSL